MEESAVAYSLPEQCWENSLSVLKTELDPQIFAAYIQPLQFDSFDGSRLECKVSAPSRFVCNHVNDYFKDKLTKAISQKSGVSNLHLKLVVNEDAIPAQPRPHVVVKKYTAAPKVLPQSKPAVSTIDSKYTFENFVVGNSNQFCHAAAMQVAENPGKSYNPLFIYSGVGLGKTHLLHAIGNAVLQKNPNANVLYLSSEAFTNELVQSIRTNTMEQFKAKMRSCDVLLIDDIQFICGKDRTQEEFFHTFSALYAKNAQIVITSDRLPQEISGLDDRLKSRFSCGLVADLQAPDYETRVAILDYKASTFGIEVPAKVNEMIADRISSNVRELEGALTRLCAVSSLRRMPITEELACSALRELLEPKRVNLSIDDIKKVVCTYFNLKLADIVSKKRTKNIAFPRHIAMYLCRKYTPASYPEIGYCFGGRDHSSVIHAISVVSGKLTSDFEMREAVDSVEKQLFGSR